ncbi:MAG: DUF6364 family protein [Candidatus Thiosymbion ectosymbiont of Robbea hypermnestra]|nr:DUF6364 family protein [Candidatus Thiosymbion ectosymbiont of Robbea hypermnestra]
MKNLTLSIDDQVLSMVAMYAAKNNSSVNSLIQKYLIEIANRESTAQKARLKIRELSVQTGARIGSKSWTRDDLHER